MEFAKPHYFANCHTQHNEPKMKPVPLSPTDLTQMYPATPPQGQGQRGHLAARRGSSSSLLSVTINHIGWLSSHLPLDQ
ncbi:hypothetical protein VZT92_012799 [Zoarces viviparus]